MPRTFQMELRIGGSPFVGCGKVIVYYALSKHSGVRVVLCKRIEGGHWVNYLLLMVAAEDISAIINQNGI
ncbi:UNVERIFIED_CONTAM: hypothetical protein FKN15_029775 [Acipenser sinensis]